MPKPYGVFRATCAHPGCNEFARYEADNRKHYIELSDEYGRGKWFCTRHSHPESVLSTLNSKTVDEVSVLGEHTGLYWGKEKAFSGFASGPGFKAFAEDFPPGTILRVTAEIILPSLETPHDAPRVTVGNMRAAKSFLARLDEADDQYQADFAIGYRDGYSDGLKDGSKSPVAQLRYISTQWPETSAGKYARAAIAEMEGDADASI